MALNLDTGPMKTATLQPKHTKNATGRYATPTLAQPEVTYLAPAYGSNKPVITTSNFARATSQYPIPEDRIHSDLGHRYRKGQVFGAIIGTLTTLGAAYVGANWLLAERVTPGTTVAGIDIGGLPKAQAIETLDNALNPKSREPIMLVAGGQTINLDPVQAGLAFDTRETVGNLTDFSLDPTRLIDHIRGGEHIAPLVLTINEPQLERAARDASFALHSEPIDGTVVFSDGRAVATAAHVGIDVSPAEIVSFVRDNWLLTSEPFVLTGLLNPPEVTQAATDAAYTLAQKITSGPLTVRLGQEQQVVLPVADLTAATTFHNVAGELVPVFNGPKLTATILSKAPELIREPSNASFAFVADRPEIVGGQTGIDLDETMVESGISAAAISANRIADIELTVTEPEISASALEALGVAEVVSSFDTVLTANEVRTNNLRRGAELINGSLLQPGETFSLLEHLNPINESNGFGNAGIIVGGVHTEGMGGGLSQLATTAYNAGFFAGFEDVIHRPHSVFISRYPAGREATIVNPSLDMEFRNNTPYGALIQSWVADNRIHVAIWSTPYFRVETSASARTNIREATVVDSNAPNCAPQSPGADGFTITNNRQVFRLDNNERVINEANTWTYRPDNGIRCVG